jgi:hypothetical protein
MTTQPQGVPYRDGTLTGDIAVGGFIWIPATDFVASAAGPALEVVDVIHHGFLLDTTGAENVSAAFFCPYGWKEADIFYYGYNAGAGSGGVALGYYLEDIVDGYSLTTETPTVATDVTLTAGAEDTLQVTAGDTGISLNSGQIHTLKVGRIVGDAEDTLANDYGLVGVLLRRHG